MELHRKKKKKKGPPGKLERLDLKAASLIPEDLWPTPLHAISEGQSAVGTGATHASVCFPLWSCNELPFSTQQHRKQNIVPN